MRWVLAKKIAMATYYPLSLMLFCDYMALFGVDNMWLTFPFLIGGTVFMLDMMARLQDFFVLHTKAFQGAGSNNYYKTLELMRYSKCQRNVAIAASCNPNITRSYYYDSGYRWYHLFPDKTFSKDSPFIKLAFWKKTLGI